MHEVHLVRAVTETVRKQAMARKAKRVTKVCIRFNPLTSHSADHVRFSFDIVKKETPMLSDAELALTEVEPTLLCMKCANKFPGHQLPERLSQVRFGECQRCSFHRYGPGEL